MHFLFISLILYPTICSYTYYNKQFLITDHHHVRMFYVQNVKFKTL